MFNPRFFFILLFFTLILDCRLSAAKTYNLLEIYSLASHYSRSLQIARLKELQSLESANSAKAGLFPTAVISVVESENSRFPVTKDSQVVDFRYRKTERTLTISQPIYNPGLYRQYRQTAQLLDYYRLSTDLGKENLMLNLLEIYFSLLKEEDNLNIVNVKLDTLKSYEESARKKAEKGLGTSTDLLKTQMEIDKTHLEKTTIEQGIESIRNQLFQLSGDRIVSIHGIKNKDNLDLSIKDKREWISRVYQNNTEIRVKEVQIQNKEAEIATIRGDWLPTIELSYTYRETDVPYSDPDETLALAFEWVIFSGNRTRANVNEKLLEKEVLLKEIEMLKLEKENQLLNTHFEMKKNRQRIQYNRKLVKIAERVRDQVKKQQQQGVKTIVDVIESENDYSLILLDLNKSYFDFLINRARLYYYSGQLTFDIMREFNALVVSD